jgi:hypothetical protein
MDKQSTAAARYYQLLTDFSMRVKQHEPAIRYRTKPDERFNLALVSYRVYGRHNEYLAIMAAASLDHVEQALPEMDLALPTQSALASMKKSAGFIDTPNARKGKV